MKRKKKQEQNNNYKAQRRQILNHNTNFVIQEAYKSLRTNINFTIRGKKCKRFCLTSAAAGEGKSITILNLAISIAQTGKKVLLIDADLRRPAIARLLVEKAAPGLAEVLTGEMEETEAIRKDVYPNLDMLFSGEIPPNPSELLGSEGMQELIDRCSEEYNYILVDVPSVGTVTDACIVASVLDGVLLLAWQNRSDRDAVRKAVNSLQLTGANVLGYVMNGTMPDKKDFTHIIDMETRV